jgi:hypothetical protein
MSRGPNLCVVLLLTVGAKISGAIAFRRAFDRMPVASARFTFALIHAKNLLDALEPPARIAEIRWRIEAALQGATQHRDDCLEQSTDFIRLQRIRSSKRTDLRVPQRFARINVADAGDPRLIEQKFLQRTTRSRNQPCERLGHERGRHRIDAKLVVSWARLKRFPSMNAP